MVAVGRRASISEELAYAGGVAVSTMVAEALDGELAERTVEAARAEDRFVLGVTCGGRGLVGGVTWHRATRDARTGMGREEINRQLFRPRARTEGLVLVWLCEWLDGFPAGAAAA